MTQTHSRWLRAILAGLLLFGAFEWQRTYGGSLTVILLVAATIALWATVLLPELLTSLLFFLVAMLVRIAPPDVVFAGFASGAFWLVLAGMVIGLAVQRSSLGSRLARLLQVRVGESYAGLLAALVMAGFALGFVFPSSMGRVALLVPLALSLAESCGFGPGSNGRKGVVFAAAFGTHLPTFAILPANVPNLVLAGSVESLPGVHLLYGDYLWLHFPVLGVLKALVLIALLVWLFPDRIGNWNHAGNHEPKLSSPDRRLLWILGFALAFWFSDSIHHIEPQWVALAAAIALLWPGWGPLAVSELKGRLDLMPLLFVAAVLGLGSLIAYSGVGADLAAVLQHWLPLSPATPLANFFTLALLALVTGLITTLPGVPAVLTPLAPQLAAAAGVTTQAEVMTQVLGFSTVLFPYQSPPLVLALALSGESMSAAVRLALALSLVTVLLLWPLDYLWWRLLGWW
jgi:di/tricarboxylate transporter